MVGLKAMVVVQQLIAVVMPLMGWLTVSTSAFVAIQPATKKAVSWSLPMDQRVRSTKTFLARTEIMDIIDDDDDVGVAVARLVQPSMALVIPRGVRNMTARGSAFVLDPSHVSWLVEDQQRRQQQLFNQDDTNCSYYLVTAAHVAAPGMDIDLRFFVNNKDSNNGNETTAVRATVLGRNRTLDLALLQVSLPQSSTMSSLITGLVLASELPPTGTRAFAHGYPASRLRGPAMTSGIVCGIADGLGLPQDESLDWNYDPTGLFANSAQDTTSFVVTNAAMSGGMSGGPLTDRRGTVMGVNALVRPDLRALGNYAVSVDQVRQFLQDLEQQQSTNDATSSSPPNNKNNNHRRYRVLLFNDPMNKRARVAKALEEVAKLDQEDANKAMMEAHTTGTGLVQEFEDCDQAGILCQALKQQDLLVEVETLVAESEAGPSQVAA